MRWRNRLPTIGELLRRHGRAGRDSALNLVLYYLGWFACIAGAAAGRPGWILTALLIAVHIALAVDRASEVKLLGAALVLGLGVEVILIATGVLRYTGEPGAAFLPPVWIAVLWLQFGSVQNFGMSWLSRRYALAAALGAAGVAPAYLAGESMGAVTLGTAGLGTAAAVAVLAAAWGLALPTLVRLADRWRPARAAYSFELPSS